MRFRILRHLGLRPNAGKCGFYKVWGFGTWAGRGGGLGSARQLDCAVACRERTSLSCRRVEY